MHRRRFVQSVVAAGCATTLLTRQSGRPVGAQTPEAAPLWTFQDDGLRGNVTTPVVTDGVVYCGSYRNGSSHVFAIDAETGGKRWSVDMAGEARRPITVGDGVIFAGTFNDEEGHLFSIDPDGTKRWDMPVGDDVWVAPVVANRVVVVGGYAAYVGFDASDGSKVRDFSLSGNKLSASAALGNVAFLGDAYDLSAFDVGGEEPIWTKTPGTVENSFITSVSAVDDTVYVGNDDSSLSAFDAATGERKWSFPADSPVQDEGGVAVADGVVYFGTFEGVFYALDAASGEQIWSHAFTSDDPTLRLMINTKPVVADGAVYVNAGLTLVAFTTSGEVMWQSAPFIAGEGGPAVANGMVFIGGDAAVLAFAAK